MLVHRHPLKVQTGWWVDVGSGLKDMGRGAYSPQQQQQTTQEQKKNKARPPSWLNLSGCLLPSLMSSIPRPHMVGRISLHRLSPCLCKHATCSMHTRVTYYIFHSLEAPAPVQHLQVGPVVSTCETSARMQRAVNIAGHQQTVADGVGE